MIKVCWISSCIFSDEPIRSTGTWLKPLADALTHSGEVELYNITRNFHAHTERQDTSAGIKQWILPNYRYGQGLLLDHEPMAVCRRIHAILDEIHPDVVHIWGTEFKWTSVVAAGHIPYPTFIDMQGILSHYAKVYYGDLSGDVRQRVAWSWSDLRHWRMSHWFKQTEMQRRGEIERQHLPLFKHISVQSSFVERCISELAPKATQLRTGIILRPEFRAAAGTWKRIDRNVVFACAGTFNLPYKGLHILIEAIGELAAKYPDIRLHLGGHKMNLSHPTDGYTRYIAQQIERLDLTDHITWLGPLDANGLVAEMLHSQLCVVPSFIETYCLAMAEAMMVGLPCIGTNAGALPELATDGEEALYYDPADPIALAKQISRLLDDASLAEKLSLKGTSRRLIDNDPDRILQMQLDNYHKVINNYSGAR